MKLSIVFSFFIISLFVSSLWEVHAAYLNFSKKPYIHISEEQPIAEFLREFCSNQGIKVIISKEVTGKKVSGKFNMKPERLFKQIISTFDLISYYDGNFLYIYHSDEAVSKFINLSHLPVGKLKAILRQNRLLDYNFPVKFYKDKKLIYVSGPPVYVSLVEDAAHMLDSKEAQEVGLRETGEAIRFFRLKYAWANDFTFNMANNHLTVPGVATILHNLLSNQKSNASLLPFQNESASTNAIKMNGLGSKKKEGRQKEDGIAGRQTLSDNGGTIQAAPRMNAVIVRDIPAKMPFYEKLIEELDIPLKLVEIKATIMDINTDALEQFGADWAVKNTHNETTNWFSSANASNSSFGAKAFDPSTGMSSNLAGGFNFTTVLGDLTDDFLMARLNIMAEEGNAKIVSRPTIITFDNVEAQLEHTKKFYVRVAGDQDVNLFEVSSGITLKVTPHIIMEDDQYSINLTVSIQNGNISSTSVDNIPIVETSTVNTQARVKENESLLIGGLINENKTTSERKIPFLGDIPYLGTLFSYESNRNTKSERLFLITPKIVEGGPSSQIPNLKNPGQKPATEKEISVEGS